MDIQCSLGENLTRKGCSRKEVQAGGAFVIGSARLGAAQPRLPCFKLGIRFGAATIKSFLESEQTGSTCQVLSEAKIIARDEIRRVRGCLTLRR